VTAPATRPGIPEREPVAELARIGITAFTTTRAHGDFSLAEPADVAANATRWQALPHSLEPKPVGLVSSKQVHSAEISVRHEPWDGWERLEGFDAHLVLAEGGAAAVTVADCVPVFIAHPSGAVAMVHAGWRGTAARILPKALETLQSALDSRPATQDQTLGARLSALDCSIHLGPAICGRCYEVGPDVYEQLTGWTTLRSRNVDLRALLAEQAKECGVTNVSASAWCTKCDNDRFFSHRAGDAGRQIAVIVAGAR
jgi:copper oxidase (laccase) domain-containing protein